MQGLCDQLTRGIHLLPLYMYIKCNGMLGLYAQLTRGVHLLPIYLYI